MVKSDKALARYEVTVRDEDGSTHIIEVYALSEAQAEMFALLKFQKEKGQASD